MAKSLFRTALNEHCEAIIVENEKRSSHLEERAKPDSAKDLMKLNSVARALGLNALLTGTLLDIRIDEAKEGLWIFEDTFPAAFLELEVNLYDVETNAVLLSELVKAMVNMSDWDRPSPTDNQRYDPRLVKKLLESAAFQLNEKICTILEKEPWKGYVIDFGNSKVEISAGTDVGLRKGDVLEVFRYEQPIEATTGEHYLISGPKIGEIRIENVFQHTAVAEIISGSDFDKSNSVKLKK